MYHRSCHVKRALNPFNENGLSLSDLNMLAVPVLKAHNEQPDVTVIPATARFYPGHENGNLLQFDRPYRIAYIGACGDLAKRFVADGARTLLESFPGLRMEVTGVDVVSKGRWVSNRLAQLRGMGLEIKEENYFTVDQFKKLLRGKKLDPFDVIFLALPPHKHLSELTDYLQLTQDYKGKIAGDKPFVRGKDLEATYKLLEQAGDRVMSVDFFSTCLPLLYLLNSQEGGEILSKVGMPRFVIGQCIEKLADQRPWLYDEELSGGGIMVDCFPHCVELANALLDHPSMKADPYSLKDLRVKNAFISEHHRNKVWRESHAVVSADFRGITCHLQSGKALPTTDYSVEFVNEDSYLKVDVGSQYHPSYIVYQTKNEPSRIIRFEGSGLGYDAAIYRMLLWSMDKDDFVQPDRMSALHGGALAGVAIADQVRRQDPKIYRYNDGRWPRVHVPSSPLWNGHVQQTVDDEDVKPVGAS